MSTNMVIGITGGTGAGKTRLVEHVISSFPVGTVAVINQDNYYLPFDDQPRDENGVENFDTLQSIDPHKMKDDILSLKSGSGFRQKLYTFNKPLSEDHWIEVNPAPLIIVEGLYSLCYPFIFELADVSVFLEASEPVMLQRRINRDERERGYDRDDVTYRFYNHFLPTYKRYVLPLRDRSSLVLNNDRPFEETALELESLIRDRIDFLK